MRSLTPAQERAVAHPAKRLQVLACAGSGKTEVLARRAVRLLLEGVDAASIIAFTFTEKAAAELKARIEARAAAADPSYRNLPPAGRGMYIGTTHGWALQALRDLGGRYELMDGLGDEQEWVLLHRFARRLGIVDLYADSEGKEPDRVPAARAITPFLRSAEVVHNERVDRDLLAQKCPQFAACLRRYEELLWDMRLLPFRMMIGHALDELTPGGRLAARLAGRVTHVLVDEFQDFNPAQDALLAALAECGPAITVLGDDDQAIYQWRGSDVSLFVDFPERHAGAERALLAENHRSRPEIVEFAAGVVERIDSRERVDKSLAAARDRHQSGAVEILVGETPEDEAECIAARIDQLLTEGHAPRDIAVLYRSVRTSAPPLVDALRSRGIPVSVIGKTSILVRQEMALIARIFVWWAGGTWYPNPEFEVQHVTRASLLAEIRALTGMEDGPARRALEFLEALGARVREEGARDSIPVFNEILVILGLPGAGWQARWREIGLGRMSELLTDFDHVARRAAPADLYSHVPAGSRSETEEDAALVANREQRPDRVLGLSRGGVYLMRLRAFLEEFAGRAAEETPDSSPEAANAVHVMTVHQSKGLEFPIVFVPSLVEGRFPSSMMARPQRWYIPDDLFGRARYEGRLDDEARLLYVALTRARELTVVSWFERHAQRQARPSIFVREHLRARLPGAARCGDVRPAALPRADEVEPIDVDFSSLVTYAACPYRYWLGHVCGFQPPIVPELGFGKVLHHVIAELARLTAGAEPPGEEDVDPILSPAFYLPFAGPVPAARLHDSARRRTRAYVRKHGPELVRTLRSEATFEVPLANARVRGRIDLLLQAEDGRAGDVELIDFKTSADRPPSDLHQDQLRLYAAAAERMGHRPARIAVHDLETGDRFDVPDDPAARARFASQLEQWVEGIRAARFEPIADDRTCRTCDFRSFCAHAPEAARTK